MKAYTKLIFYLSPNSPGDDNTGISASGIRHVSCVHAVPTLIIIIFSKVPFTFVKNKMMNKTFIAFLYKWFDLQNRTKLRVADCFMIMTSTRG